MSQTSATTVPIDFVRQLLDGPALPHPTRQLCLQQAGIPLELMASSQARVTTDQFAALYRLVVRHTGDESPGMFSRPLKPGTLKFLALSVVQAPSLLTALHRFTQFFQLVLDDLQFELVSSPEQVSVVLLPQTDEARHRRFAQEVMLKLVHGMASWLAGRKIPITRVDLAYAPPAYASDYVYLYPGQACFNQAVTAIHFDRPLLDGPVRQRADAIGDFLVRAPADWMFVSFAERFVSHRVREQLECTLPTMTRIEDVARSLLLSTRTLARRLEQEGTTFQLLKDELRRDIAIRLLMQTHWPPEAIGAQIGFEDPTTFYRAFKRWTGCSPGMYRRSGGEPVKGPSAALPAVPPATAASSAACPAPGRPRADAPAHRTADRSARRTPRGASSRSRSR